MNRKGKKDLIIKLMYLIKIFHSHLLVLFVNVESLLVLIKLVDSFDVAFDRFVESKSNLNHFFKNKI